MICATLHVFGINHAYHLHRACVRVCAVCKVWLHGMFGIISDYDSCVCARMRTTLGLGYDLCGDTN